jgi:hypothetical protein
MVLLASCFLLAGLIDSPAENDIAQLTNEQKAEIVARQNLHRELLAANDLDLQQSLAQYTGPASRQTKSSRQTIKKVQSDLLERELIEAKQ